MPDGPLDPASVIERGLLVVHVDDPSGGRLRLVGEADLDSSEALAEALDVLVAAGATAAVLDVSDLTYLDSTTIRVLVHGIGVLADGITIEHPSVAVARVLEVMALGQVLRIVP